jgi:hypothetical protein
MATAVQRIHARVAAAAAAAAAAAVATATATAAAAVSAVAWTWVHTEGPGFGRWGQGPHGGAGAVRNTGPASGAYTFGNVALATNGARYINSAEHQSEQNNLGTRGVTKTTTR